MKVVEFTGKITRKDVEAAIDRRSVVDEAVVDTVRTVIAAVREGGDAAVAEYTREFDGVVLPTGEFQVSKADLTEAYNRVDGGFLIALRAAIESLRRFHERVKITPIKLKGPNGAVVEERVLPLDRVGVYVPGGRFPLPSTVLMNVIPAKTAGVKQVIVCSPPSKDGDIDENILVAAAEAGADLIFRIGGAQAIAAMAYGTDIVPRVDKVTGPGNVYVTMAKREVFGDVGIDMLAGPSEVVILADESANPEFIAQDMRAQNEHDPDAQAILVTTSVKTANQVDCLIESESMKILVCETSEAAISIVNYIAPEHLQIMTRDAERVAGRVVNAGAIFVGAFTPAAVGDYIAGPNHILPTSGTARFSSPLSVYDFVKRTSVIRYTPEALAAVAGVVETLAETEGLVEHAKSIKIRVTDT